MLALPQCWEGLKIKAREPQAFLPISECTITEDRREAGITHRIKFIEGKGSVAGEATEVVTYYSPMRASFLLGGGVTGDTDIVVMDF